MDLKEARRLTGLTQTRLAELAGLQQTTIYDLEAGRNRRPSHEAVTRIVRALQRSGLAGISAEELFPVPDDERTEASA